MKPPVRVRGDTVKAELSDTEGLGFKLEERQKDILQLKTALKMKVRISFCTYMYVYSDILVEEKCPDFKVHKHRI